MIVIEEAFAFSRVWIGSHNVLVAQCLFPVLDGGADLPHGKTGDA